MRVETRKSKRAPFTDLQNEEGDVGVVTAPWCGNGALVPTRMHGEWPIMTAIFRLRR